VFWVFKKRFPEFLDHESILCTPENIYCSVTLGLSSSGVSFCMVWYGNRVSLWSHKDTQLVHHSVSEKTSLHGSVKLLIVNHPCTYIWVFSGPLVASSGSLSTLTEVPLLLDRPSLSSLYFSYILEQLEHYRTSSLLTFGGLFPLTAFSPSYGPPAALFAVWACFIPAWNLG
jgi:hypothetical protein